MKNCLKCRVFRSVLLVSMLALVLVLNHLDQLPL